MKNTRSIDWPVRALPWIAAAILVLTSCGTPQPSVTIHNVVDATAQPGVGTSTSAPQAPTTAGQQAAAAPTSMPGMAETTTAQAPSSANASDPAPTDFVAAWVLFGTPTPSTITGSGGSAATTGAQATTAQSTTRPTVPPTAKAGPTATAGGSTTGSAGGASAGGDPVRGKQVFNTAGCTACHDVANGITIVGPSLKGLASRAGTRKPGMSAEDYLRESIMKPNAFIVPNFQPGIMLQNFGQVLSPQQLNDVIAYLMTLK